MIKNFKKLLLLITEKDKWYSSEGRNENTPFLLRFRPHLEKFCKEQVFNTHIIVLWKYKSEGDSRLPEKMDLEQMEKFEDLMVYDLEKDLQAVLSFVYTGQNLREWHFYSRGNVLETQKRIIYQQQFITTSDSIEIQVDEDPMWSEYNAVLKNVIS